MMYDVNNILYLVAKYLNDAFRTATESTMHPESRSAIVIHPDAESSHSRAGGALFTTRPSGGEAGTQKRCAFAPDCPAALALERSPVSASFITGHSGLPALPRSDSGLFMLQSST